ncbi:DciA family protein [Actinomyces sp. B33]|uniref:DUF721 domain-containing protein n=1 Tax=Actinomyces sp. B33 TaxID=2942131 RepID=UPI00234277B2|nr:DciA family protein [Actinomyces sp. B33]MDC4232548.1 DciA family protein [Actinomyces sp. B33]
MTSGAMGVPPEERVAEEYLARALERAQAVARAQGFMRTSLPAWGLGDEPRRPRGADGSSESSPIDATSADSLDDAGSGEEGPGAGEDRASAPSAAPGASDRPGGDDDVDPEGDLTALRALLAVPGARWSRIPGMAPMRRQYRSMRPLGSSIDRIIRVNQWGTATRMGSIMAKWPVIVGETVAEHAAVETFEEHRLIVRCSSTAWANQLRLLLPMIERRIAEEVGTGVVEQVVILGPIAPSWKKGPLSVRGRGPRDTYG